MAPNVTTDVSGGALLSPAFDTLPSNIAIIDADGQILATNSSWEAFAEANGIQTSPATLDVNYLDVTDAADDPFADRAAAGIRAVLQGERDLFELEYPCHSPEEKRWFLLRAAPFTQDGDRYATVAHVDVSERRERERALRTAYEISASDHPLSQQVDALLELGREVLGLQFGTLSHVQGDEYTFEAVAVPDDVELEEGHTAPLATLPNCERVVETEETLVLRDVAAEAPELLDDEWEITAYLGAPVVVNGDVRGTFCFYSKGARAEAFSDWEVMFVELLSDWVSNALERRHYSDVLTALETAFPDLAFLIDAEGMYLDSLASSETADLLAGAPEDLPGRTLHEVLPSDTADFLLATVREALDTADLQTVEYILDVPAGTRWFEGRVAPFALSAYGPDTVVFVARDITERKEREQKYRRLTERISDAYYAFDADWTVTYWNDSIAERSGVPSERIVGENFWEIYPELEGTVYEETLRAAMQSQEPQSCEFYYEQGAYWVDVVAYSDAEGISVISQDITERKKQQRELEAQRDRLAHLDRLNTLVRELIQALQDTASREAIETAVCERLTRSELYQSAWVGVRGATVTGEQTVIPQTAAGIDADYLEGIPAFQGPANRAVQTGAVQVVEDIAAVEAFPEARREQALDHDHHALAAVPFTTAETTYGVLVVYLPTTHTITDDERTVLGDLGQMVAQAIQRVHSQRALNAETMVALDLRLPDTDLILGEASQTLDCELGLEQRITTDDGAIYYLSVHDADPERVCDFLRAGPLDGEFTVVREAHDGRPPLIELHFEERPRLPSDVLSKYGGSMTTARFVDGDVIVGAELPPGVDVRTVVDALRELAPGVELIRKEYVDRPRGTASGLQAQIMDELTPKQKAALEAAHARGYYSWPRETTVEELAETFSISGSTLHYRLRKAHETVVTAVVDGE